MLAIVTRDYFFASPMGVVAKYCDKYVCLWLCLPVSVCLSDCEDITRSTRVIVTKFFLCMLPLFVARSSSGMFTIGCIAYCREGVFFPTDNASSAGKGGWECTAWARCAIYDCLLVSAVRL